MFESEIREIIKDAEDAEGDGYTHCRTIPVVYGLNKTKTILYFFILMLLSLLLVYESILFKMELFMAFALITAVTLLTFLLIFRIYKAKEHKDFHRLSVLSKLMMLIGLLSMLVLR